MERPFYTADRFALRAYLESGQILELHQGPPTVDFWPIIDLSPPYMDREPGPDERPITRELFAQAYQAAQQAVTAAALLALPPSVVEADRPYQVVALVTAPGPESESEPDAFGLYEADYHAGPALDAADSRMLARPEQLDRIRELLGGRLSLQEAIRFDPRCRRAYTEAEAEALIVHLQNAPTHGIS